jgi:hypothetical protein
MEATVKAAPRALSDAAYVVRQRAQRISQMVDDGALDSTVDDHDPVTDKEVADMRATRPETRR